MKSLIGVTVLFLIQVSVVLASVDFETCLQQVQNGDWGPTGGTDNFGRPVKNISDATAITYELCIVACGKGSEPVDWNDFSQQFSTWLLPYLALLSQLPFGAKSRLDNLVSILLTVGSPTLATYSLALTVLNGHYIVKRFSHLNYPNVRSAVQILNSLQHSSFHVNTDESLLASLIVLPENDKWWSELVPRLRLSYVQTWSISAVASILWVLVAYLLTVLDSFTSAVTNSMLNANGQAVGSNFLWLLPIVIGWWPVSPDHSRVRQAMKRANKIAHVATPNGRPVLASRVTGTRRAIALRRDDDNIHRDEYCTTPIYNYARFLSWSLAVETVFQAFRQASERSDGHQPVNSRALWKGDKNSRVRPENRKGSLAQVAAYVEPKLVEAEMFPERRSQNRWGPGVVSRFLLASVLALSLTWGTIGAAILVVFFTPTKGLACRSGSYLIYGVCSTLVWMMLVASSILAHYSTFVPTFKDRFFHTRSTRLAGTLAIILRRSAKILAALNSVWIILVCILQFGSFFDTCWCNSCVFYLGKNAYNVIEVTSSDVAALNAFRIGGVVLAGGCAVLFLGFVNLLMKAPLPD